MDIDKAIREMLNEKFEGWVFDEDRRGGAFSLDEALRCARDRAENNGEHVCFRWYEFPIHPSPAGVVAVFLVDEDSDPERLYQAYCQMQKRLPTTVIGPHIMEQELEELRRHSQNLREADRAQRAAEGALASFRNSHLPPEIDPHGASWTLAQMRYQRSLVDQIEARADEIAAARMQGEVFNFLHQGRFSIHIGPDTDSAALLRWVELLEIPHGRTAVIGPDISIKDVQTLEELNEAVRTAHQEFLRVDRARLEFQEELYDRFQQLYLKE
jgi:hypothetical protein